MSVEEMIKESIQEELRSRINIAIEAKMGDIGNISESAKKYGVDTGPLMNAKAWIAPSKLSVMVQELRSEGEKENIAIAQMTTPKGSSSQIAMPLNGPLKSYFDKGANHEYTFYMDTGNGHRQTQNTIRITGLIEKIKKDGSIKSTGSVNMNSRTTLMVFK
jgi:hypothetical protein